MTASDEVSETMAFFTEKQYYTFFFFQWSRMVTERYFMTLDLGGWGCMYVWQTFECHILAVPIFFVEFQGF